MLDLAAATVAPELAYVTARYAALMPFGKAASLLTELLPIGGAVNAGTVRNRTMRVGQDVVPPHPIPMEPLNAPQPVEAIVVGLDGGGHDKSSSQVSGIREHEGNDKVAACSVKLSGVGSCG